MNFLKRLTLIGLSLTMAACASTQIEQQQYSSTQSKAEKQTTSVKTKRQQISEELSPNITFPPTIDVAYIDIEDKVDQHIGTTVRWGGQVIESTQIDDSTIRMTVFSHPLTNDGRPLKQKAVAENGGRFIVELKDSTAKDIDFKGRFITLYGGITSKLVVKNGEFETTIPVINAQELVDWNRVDQIRSYAKNLRSRAYYNRSYGYYGPSYGRGFFRYKNSHYSFGFHNRFYGFGHRSYRRW